MIKNKKITTLLAVSLLATTLVGCSKMSKEDAHEEFDKFVDISSDVTTGIVDSIIDAMGEKELEVGEFDSKEFEEDLKDAEEEFKKLKLKPLKEYGALMVEQAYELSDLIEDYVDDKIDEDKLMDEFDSFVVKGEDKIIEEIERLAEDYDYDIESVKDEAEEDLENYMKKSVLKLFKNGLSNVVEDALDNIGSDTMDLADKSTDKEVSEIKIYNEETSKKSTSVSTGKYATEFDNMLNHSKQETSLFKYVKGQNKLTDDLVKAISDFYENGFAGVELELYKKGRIDSATSNYTIEPLTSEDKKKIEDKRASMISQFFSNGMKGIDSISVSYNDYVDVVADEQLEIDFTFNILNHEGTPMAIIGKPFDGFKIVKHEGEVKIILDEIL